MSMLSKIFKKKKIKKTKSKRKAAGATKRKLKKRVIRKKAGKKPIKKENLIGVITHYFPHVKAAVIKIKKDSIGLKDTLHIKGHTTDFVQKVNSLQIDRSPIKKAKKGAEIGLRVKSRVRHNDLVYKL